MTRRRSTGLLLLAGFAVFIASVAWIETHARAAALQRVEQHARAIAPALWNLDPRLAEDYLRLAAESYGYATIAIHTSSGRTFLTQRGPELREAERVLDRLGLLPRVQLSAPVMHETRMIGRVSADWISRSLYTELYLLGALVLALVLAERSLRVIEGKRTLEQRVIERTRQLAEREASHRQLTRLLDLSPDVVFVREASGEMIYWNEGATRLFGPGERPAIAERLQTFYNQAIAGDRAGTLATIGTWAGEVDAAIGDGPPRKLHASLSLTPDESGAHQRVLFIATDITVRKELESHLLRAQRAQAVGTLASGVAHDFNNLLTPILLSAQLLRSDAELSAANRSVVETVEQCARRGADLVRQLLNLSGNRPAHRAAVQPTDLLRDIAQLLQGTFPKTIELETDWPARLPTVEADATNLHQAILNLCVNARDAMPGGGRLRLTAASVTLNAVQRARRREISAGEWIAITVTDTGTGIAPELLEKIFEPFFTTKETGRGTGLGLATVQGIAHSHGGFVEVTSTPGQGSTFTLYLPAQTQTRNAEAGNSLSAPPRAMGEKILLVDDEPAVLQTTTRLLQSGGYHVLAAASGAEALRLQREHGGDIHAALTDLMMPGMDGVALARALREADPGLPIAVMTGLLHQANRDTIAAAGFRATLAKPYRAEELLWCVQRLVQSRR